jgi:uncharacterized protein YbcC (UPF0753/DUF2309 family)
LTESPSPEPTKLRAAAVRACDSIAPTWPLDRFIAVNPFWSRTDEPLPRVAGDLAALSGVRLLMPRAWYAAEWRAERLRPEHLREAIAQSGLDISEKHLSGLLRIEEPPLRRRPLVVDVMDARWRRELEVSWRDYVVERISRFCASYFDDGQAPIRAVREGGLYASWRSQAEGDRSPALFMGLSEYRSAFAALPSTADETILAAASDLGVPPGEYERYLSALLLDINGWASWCAYLRWTARLAGRDDDHIRELLAIRIAWEWLLFRCGGEDLRVDWGHAVASWPTFDGVARAARADDWLFQSAMEIAWTSALRRKLPEGFAAARPSAPRIQAAFCLDVRSEIYRRALEAQGADIETLGCAGFFGMPIEYAPLAAESARPQLPGLVAPEYRVTDTGVPEALEGKRASRLHASHAWKAFKWSSLSSFAFVDAIGLSYARGLLGETFGSSSDRNDSHEHAGLSAAEDRTRTPRITSRADGRPLSLEERCDLADGILRTLSLTRSFARFVLLVGHRGGSRNNPYAAALDCGACGGQPGDVNVRAAAALLNDTDIRTSLASRGIPIPMATVFVAGLHNTTTDEVTLFEQDTVPPSHRPELADLRATLERAGTMARRKRAPRLGLDALSDARLRAAVVERSKNWAEVRPEWGLAGNATFIVAPRERTRHLDLEGRAFLHDYRAAEDDDDGSILERIMTGPMVVTHWINFQYYASTVDNTRYGTGNKTLHNVVGAHLGVYEGNGGDLRIGLSLQSLHDGTQWMHSPLRLSVFIEAPRSAIDAVLAKHAKVRELVDNEWLHLFQIDVAEGATAARRNGKWIATPG